MGSIYERAARQTSEWPVLRRAASYAERLGAAELCAGREQDDAQGGLVGSDAPSTADLHVYNT